MSHHTRYVGTNILFVRNGQVLLARRANSGWADGMLGIPGGHLEAGEAATQAAAREVEEELGLVITQERLEFFTTAVVHGAREYVYLEFYVTLHDDEMPINAEPHKCSELVWCDPHNLPQDIPESFRVIITEGYVGGSHYFEIGY